MGGGAMLVSLPILFCIVVAVSLFSSLFLLYPKAPLNYVRIHIGVISLPPIVALFALIFHRDNSIWGPLQFHSLSWLLAVFVLTIGLIVQRFSVHYLLGDRSYRKYFSLLTLTTVAGSLAWFSNDLRFLLICWGTALLGLTFIIRLKKEWQAAKHAASLMGRLFTISWLLLLLAILWVAGATGHWQLSQIMTQDSLLVLQSWEKTCIHLLLILSIVIPAGQWPFHRWLLDSAVAPTPVSAIMHAGIVNAGGIILTLFAPMFNGGDAAQIVLLILSGVSVLMGTGIMLVHVDYKRQLIGSTIAQMGFMLIQCALGAYLAAIIHAVLHGLYKSTLFLQAGSALGHDKPIKMSKEPASLVWTFSGVALGILAGIGYWLTSPEEAYQIVSAIILGWSVSFAWTQLVAFGYGRIGRISGLSLFLAGAIVYVFIHSGFHHLLHESIHGGTQPSVLAVILLLFILLAGSAIGLWLARKRSSKAFTILYLWLVALGEPDDHTVESLPKYPTQSMS
jgi:NAD(P)H-quinone oxidoreductase subunit 5